MSSSMRATISVNLDKVAFATLCKICDAFIEQIVPDPRQSIIDTEIKKHQNPAMKGFKIQWVR